MSWLSSLVRRNSNVIQAIAKPLVSHIPVIGDTLGSRILMSPTPTQENAVQAVAQATNTVTPFVQAVAVESKAPTPAAFTDPQRAILPAPTMDTQKMLMIGGGVLLLIVLLFALTSRRN